MSKIFSEAKKEKEDLINKLFEERNINDDINFDYFTLKRKLLISNGLKKDIQSLQLILDIFLYKAYSLIKNNDEIRPIKKDLFLLIKNHDTFRYFLYNNNIDDNTLLKIIPHLKYKHFIENEIIFKEGEDSLYMYFILKGKVSVMNGSKKLNQIKVIKEKENFGQWDIIYHRKRKLSYYASEECHIIYIDKHIVRKYLQEKIIKGDNDIKTFATKFLKNNKINSFLKIERVINNMKILYYRKGEIIYKEGEENTNIYLVYKGETKLVKKIKNGEFTYIENLNDNIYKIQEKAKNLNYKNLISDEISEKKLENEESKNNNNTPNILIENSEYKTLAILGKGNIGGLEISTGIKNKKYTMIANHDYTTIIQIELYFIKDNINKFLLNLLPLFIQSEKDIHSRFKQIRKIENKMQTNYKNNNIDNLSLLNNNKYYINEIQKINKKLDINEGGFIIVNDFNIKLNNSKNKLKEQLIRSNKKYLEINMLANDYNKKEENKNNNYNQVKMMKNNNIKKYKLNLNIPIKCRSRTYNKRIYFKKNMSQKYFAKKTLENFDIVIENYRRRKDFLIRDFVNPQIIKTERANEKMEFNSDDNRLLKEIIILNKENNKEIEEYKGKSYNNQSSKYKDIKFKKRINSALNKVKTFENKKENKIFIINKYILRRLFAKNMIKKKKIKSLDIKSISNIEKRILYYNTGRYDMPFVTNLI